MRKTVRLIRLLIYISLSVHSIALLSQGGTGNSPILPEEGMEGKNVPYITTPQELVKKMLELAKITPEDFLIDLGSGDGRTVITAAKMGTRSLGIEYNPDLVKLSEKNASTEGVSDLARFVEGDFFEFDFSEATVITLFLLPEINMKLRPKLFALKPGTRIVSNTFPMQEWHFDEAAYTGDESNRWNTAYLWIVPAKVGGRWTLSEGGEIVFRQDFQELTGWMTVGNEISKISEGRLRGNQITFSANGTIFSGLVSGDRIEGSYKEGRVTNKWSASR
jgi:precorrin-6B methylase 2